MGIPLGSGRGFGPQDTASSQKVAVISESMAQRFFPGASPLGKRFGLDKPDNTEGHGASKASTCSPTWAQPAASGALVYVACNKMDEIVEVDVSNWKITRRLKTGVGPYNLAVPPDRKLLVATPQTKLGGNWRCRGAWDDMTAGFVI
jgi:hypothetical protein